MKVYPVIFSILLSSYLFGQSVTDQFEKRIHTAYGKTIPYRLFIPKNYSELSDYPLILTLHGSGERGTDNVIQITTFRIAEVWAEDSIQQKYPSFVLSPQCPTGFVWDTQFDILSDLILSLIDEFSIDSTRLYATGFSMGGYGVWSMMVMMPLKFAAIVPVAGGGFSEIVPILSNIPAIWNFHAIDDYSVSIKESRNIIHAIEGLLGMEALYPELKDGLPSELTEDELDSALTSDIKLIYTEYKNGGHLGKVDLTYNNPKMHKWLFDQHTQFKIQRVPESFTTNESSKFSHVSDQPVFNPGISDSWDDWTVSDPAIIKDGDTLKMWYVGWESGWSKPTHVGYAWSLDGANWQRYSNNPVLSPDLEWEGERIGRITVIKDEGLYKMWYSANEKVFFPTVIGYAFSKDGINWTKHEDPVLFSGDLKDWDFFNITAGTVIREGDSYRLWYHGGTWPTGMQIGLATSTDGINWTKYNDPLTNEPPFNNSDPVLKVGQFMKDWDFHSVWYPAVWKDSKKYHMWYSGSRMGMNDLVYYAISSDGITWYKSQSNPVLAESPAWSYDGSGYYCGSILNYDYEYHFWYSLYGPKSDTYDIGYARDFSHMAHSDFMKISSTYHASGSDQIVLHAGIVNPNNHSLEVIGNIISDDQEVDIDLPFSDDGAGADLLAGDGIWSTIWPLPAKENYYTVYLSTSDMDTGYVFHHMVTKRFTSVGPVKLSHIEPSDSIANPGKNIYYGLVLSNYSQTDSIRNVTSELVTTDTCVDRIQRPVLSYPDIAAGQTGISTARSRITFSDNCTHEIHPIRFNLNIFSGDDLFWQDSLVIVVGLEKIVQIHSHFSLYQNYPNPFNPSTTIRFQIPNSEFTTLKVYNVLGEVVKTLVSNKLNQGNHTFQFDGKNLASGIYYYQLVAGEYREVKKMILLK